MLPKRFYLFIILLAAGAAGCGARRGEIGAAQTDASANAARAVSEAADSVPDATPAGPRFRLRSLSTDPGAVPIPLSAEGASLSDPERTALLSRISPVSAAPDEGLDISFSEGISPGYPVRTVPMQPSPEETLRAPRPSGDFLQVLGYEPRGEVDVAPHLSVTFSKPMIPDTAADDAALRVPIRMAPTQDGEWRAVGTRTFIFYPRESFKGATRYRVEIPRDWASMDGDTLRNKVSFSFKTPPLRIEESSPDDATAKGLLPTIFIRFNQRIDADTVMKFLSVTQGGKEIPTTRVSAAALEQLSAEETAIKARAKIAPPGTWLALRPKIPLPNNRLFRVVLRKGAPSAEGPLKTKEETEFAFRTAPAFAVTEHGCGGAQGCSPDADFTVHLSNAIDMNTFDPALVRIEPPLEHARIEAAYRSIRIAGQKSGAAAYTVTVPASLKDTFGQRLEKDTSLRFEVAPAAARLLGFNRDIVTLNAAKKAVLPVRSVQLETLRVEIKRVTPPDFRQVQTTFHRQETIDTVPKTPLVLPGETLFEGTIPISGPRNSINTTAIDLSPYLKDGVGQFLVRVRPGTEDASLVEKGDGVVVWVQVTHLCLNVYSDASEAIVWTFDLKSARPSSGAMVELIGRDSAVSRTADTQGIARLPLPDKSKPGDIVLAKNGADTAMMPYAESFAWGGGGWYADRPDKGLRFFTFDDGGLYRPGQTVHIRGWLRVAEKSGGVALPSPLPAAISWRLLDARGAELDKGSTSVSDLAGFQLAAVLPEEMRLGAAALSITADNDAVKTKHLHRFRVEDAPRPAVEVTVNGELGNNAVVQGDEVNLSLASTSVESVAHRPVTWTAVATPADYAPPGYTDYRFGQERPDDLSLREADAPVRESLQSTTDASGRDRAGLVFESGSQQGPVRVQIEGRIEGRGGRRNGVGEYSFWMHPAKRYVGIRLDRGFMGTGKQVRAFVVVTDIEGALQERATARVTLSRIEAQKTHAHNAAAEVKTASCVVRTATEAPAYCDFTPDRPGLYRISAEVRDENGKESRSDASLWVFDAKSNRPMLPGEKQVRLVAEREFVQPRETASFLLLSPIFPAEGILTVHSDGIKETRAFHIDGPTAVLSYTVGEDDIPGFSVQVDLVAPGIHDPPLAPSTGFVHFQVPPRTQTLDVALDLPKKSAAPGETITATVSVKHRNGSPAAFAEVQLGVKESSPTLSGDRTPDPLSAFFTPKRDTATVRYQHLQLQVGTGIVDFGAPPSPSGALSTAAVGPYDDLMQTLDETTRFSPLPSPTDAAFDNRRTENRLSARASTALPVQLAPTVKTDKNGLAKIAFAVPRTAAPYVVWASAATEAAFGTGEKTLVARHPLLVSQIVPRFVRVGDRFEPSLTLQNQTESPLTVQVAIRAALVTFEGGRQEAGKSITVPPNDRVEVRFSAIATRPGRAVLKTATASGGVFETATVELPVYPPAQAVSFASEAILDDKAAQHRFSLPKDTRDDFGGAELIVSPFNRDLLNASLGDLLGPPIDLPPQRAFRALAAAALLKAPASALPAVRRLRDTVEAELNALVDMQNDDGGFGFCNDTASAPYPTLLVAHAVAAAKETEIPVPENLRSLLIAYLSNIEERLPRRTATDISRFIRGYAVFVLGRLGEPAVDKAIAFVAETEIDALETEIAAFVLPTLDNARKNREVARILRRLSLHANPDASAASTASVLKDEKGVPLRSARTADAAMLLALLTTRPTSALIPPTALRLRAAEPSSLRNDPFVFEALAHYFDRFERVSSNAAVSARVGTNLAFEATFHGRNAAPLVAQIPISALLTAVPSEMTIEKRGKGRLLYRTLLRYASDRPSTRPVDAGFSVMRTFHGVDAPDDVRRDQNGVWHIRRGARVTTQLFVVAAAERFHAVLTDPVPAGFVPLKPLINEAGTAPKHPDAKQNRYWWWKKPWFEHQNLRDNLAEAYTSVLGQGVHEYAYITRANVPGVFTVPPAHIATVFNPDIFGNTGTDNVVVE